MDKQKADEIQFALIQFFESRFDKNLASVTATGVIKFDTERDFALWYQLSERLYKRYNNKYVDLLAFLRKHYAGKTPDDIKHEQIPTRIPTAYERTMMDLGIEIEEDI